MVNKGFQMKQKELTKTLMKIFQFETTLYNNISALFKPSRCIKASFYIPEIRPNFPTTKGFRREISMKLVYQYMAIFFTFSPTSNHLHPLQVDNCDSNSRLVVDEDDNVKSGWKGLKEQ